MSATTTRRSTKRNRVFPSVLDQLAQDTHRYTDDDEDDAASSSSSSSDDTRAKKRNKTNTIVVDEQLELSKPLPRVDEYQTQDQDQDAEADVKEPDTPVLGDAFVLPPAPSSPSPPSLPATENNTNPGDAQVVTDCAPSELDVAYGMHLHPLHHSHIDPTSARLKLEQVAAAKSSDSKDDDHKGAAPKVPLPSVVFGDPDKSIDVFMTQQGRVSWDTDLVWGNYVDPMTSERTAGKFDSTDKAKVRISVGLMFPENAPFVQWLEKVRDTVMHKIIEEKDPSMLHVTQPLYDAAVETYNGLGLEPEMTKRKVMEKYRKDARALFHGTYTMKEDKRYGWGAGINASMTATAKLSKKAEAYLTSDKMYGNPPEWPHPLMQDLFENKITYLAADLPVTHSDPMPKGGKAPVARVIKFESENDAKRFIHGGTNVALQVQMRIVKHPDTGGYTFSYRLKAVHICGTEFNGESGSNRVGGVHGDPLIGFAVAP